MKNKDNFADRKKVDSFEKYNFQLINKQLLERQKAENEQLKQMLDVLEYNNELMRSLLKDGLIQND